MTIDWQYPKDTTRHATLNYDIGIPGAMVAVQVHVMRMSWSCQLTARVDPARHPHGAGALAIESTMGLPAEGCDDKIQHVARMMATQVADLAAEVK